MERWVAKLLVLLLIFIMVFAVTILPLKVEKIFLKQGAKGARIISCLMCFGGGVFLSVYMLHMAPDARQIINEALAKPNNISYPIADFIIACGFFMMILSESIVERCHGNARKKKHKVTKDIIITHDEKTTEEPLESDVNKNGLPIFGDDITDCDTQSKKMKLDITFRRPDEENNLVDKHSTDHTLDGYLEQSQDGQQSNVHAVTRSLVFLLALSLHHVFEGIGIGLKETVTAVISMCIAIICHEFVVAFSLGMQLVKTYKSRQKVVLAAFLCSLMVPVGVVVGMAISETGHHETLPIKITNGVLQGLATGVFLYVTFFEILQSEFGGGNVSWDRLFFLLLGFGVLALMGLIPEDIKVKPMELSNNGSCICARVIN